MTDELDVEQVLLALTDGIGADLGRSVRASYYETLKRLTVHESFLQLDLVSRQELVDILALSMFYNIVISPLESGQSLLSLVQRAKATHVRIGHDKLTPVLAARFGSCASAFHKILSKQRIPVDVLSFPSLNVFIAQVHAVKELSHSETMD